MNDKELPLVGFTVLSQLAVGLSMVLTILTWAKVPESIHGNVLMAYLFCEGVLGVAMAVSLLHLGHPLGSIRAVVHLGKSWLSREIAGFGLFGFFLFLQILACLFRPKAMPFLSPFVFISGLTALYASARVYSPPSYPALNNQLPFIIFLISAMLLGPAFLSYFMDISHHPWLIHWLTIVLITGGIINVMIPSVWMSGNRVMKNTGKAFYGSPVFWIRILGEFVIPAIIIFNVSQIPVWLPVVLLAGELGGRVLFFSHVYHLSSNIGGRY